MVLTAGGVEVGEMGGRMSAIKLALPGSDGGLGGTGMAEEG